MTRTPGRFVGPVRAVRAALAAVSLVLCLAACSSSKKTPAATRTSSSPPSSASGTGSAADIAAIKTAYTELFAEKTPLDTSVADLQDGEAFRSTLVSQGKSSLAAQASATVSKVVVTSPNRASVTFSILINGSPILPNQSGYAVRENGKWKVAGTTFCGLLTAEGNPPAACKLAAATALPS